MNNPSIIRDKFVVNLWLFVVEEKSRRLALTLAAQGGQQYADAFDVEAGIGVAVVGRDADALIAAVMLLYADSIHAVTVTA